MASQTKPTEDWDIIVVGSGNAGLTAALSAALSLPSARVLLIDKCPANWAGGNSFFTAGAFRTVHSGLADILPLVNNTQDISPDLIDLPPYPASAFHADLDRVTSGRYDPALGAALVDRSRETVGWLAAQAGVRFQLSFNRQAYQVDGRRWVFWGGLCLKTQEGGKGLVEDLLRAATKAGVVVRFDTAAQRIVMSNEGKFEALQVDGDRLLRARALILAAGGFEANPRMRSRFLGDGWEQAHVRGTPFNTGEMLESAIETLGATRVGDWEGCHSVAWDADSPAASGDREKSNEFTKSGYPLGITVNRLGERFFDEGSDMRNYTYAKFGRAILAQPGGVAFQLWDGQGIPWLRAEEYRDEIVRKTYGDTIEELAAKLAQNEGLDSAARLVETVQEYNEAVGCHRQQHPDAKWDPSVKDGLSTQSTSKSLRVPKSNWALPLSQGPFMAVKVCCGVTFTFGGLAVDPDTSAVLSSATGKPIPGVFAAGEMVGGLFHENYPGGSGLTSGAVFGRRAGVEAAALVEKQMAKQTNAC